VLGRVSRRVPRRVPRRVVGQVVGQLAGQVVGQLAGQVVGQLAGQVVGQLAGQLVGQLAGQVVGQLAGQVVGQLAGQLAGQVSLDAYDAGGDAQFRTQIGCLRSRNGRSGAVYSCPCETKRRAWGVVGTSFVAPHRRGVKAVPTRAQTYWIQPTFSHAEQCVPPLQWTTSCYRTLGAK